MYMALLVGWFALVWGVAFGLKAGNEDELFGKFVAGWWMFVASIVTCVVGNWLVIDGYLFFEEPEVLAFRVCGGILILVGAFLVPLQLGRMVRRHSQDMKELQTVTTAVTRKEPRTPAWKRVEEQSDADESGS